MAYCLQGVAQLTGMTEEDLQETEGSGNAPRFYKRMNWAVTHLAQAGFITRPRRGRYQLTQLGLHYAQDADKKELEITNNLLASLSPEFRNFLHGKKEKYPPQPGQDPLTPEEQIDKSFAQLNDVLADNLLNAIMKQTPQFFEALVVKLMEAMGYGNGFVTKQSNDQGIDGIIHGDRLGFNLIYVQAKRWNPDKTVNRPDLQGFVGAMQGPPRIANGLFITTAKFSQGALEYAQAQHVITIDGQQLTRLMIEYNLGVSAVKTYTIKRLDSDFFEPELSE